MKRIMLLFLFIFICWFGFAGPSAGAVMNDYCINPVFGSTSAKPNVLILMDLSGSMQFPAYIDCISDGYGGSDNKVAKCGAPVSSAESNYSVSRTYNGLFDASKYYRYNAPVSGKFQVNTACADTDRIGSGNACISGNLLNWITATRVDVTRKILTGGRTGTGATDTYKSEGAQVIYTDNSGNLNCKFTITAGDNAKARKIAIENREGGYTCPLGTLGGSSIDIVPPDTPDTGIIQDFYDKVTFEFMVAANDNRAGKMISGKGAPLSSIVSAIFNEIPYSKTPLGNALWEAYDYFAQSNDHSYYDNSAYIGKGDGSKDPYYDGSGSGSTGVYCRKAFVLLLSDGAWNVGLDPVIPARTMHTTDLRSDLSGSQTVNTYVVYAFGDSDADVKQQGRNTMITTAVFGGFDYAAPDAWPYPFTGYSDTVSVCNSIYKSTASSNIADVDGNTYCNSRATPASPDTYPLVKCNPAGTWNAGCKKWDRNKTGLPYNFFEAGNGDALAATLHSALNDMISGASSGTAATVLASGQGSGANLLQAVFYPKRSFIDTDIRWTGEIRNLWYYIDPYLQNSAIREDTDGNKILNLDADRIIKFDAASVPAKAKLYNNANADGAAGSSETGAVALEDIKHLWEAGTLLFQRNLATSPRTIYTTINGSAFLTNNFSTSNKAVLRPYLQAVDAAEAEKIINYVHGIDQPGYRNRTVTIGTATGVWKLGDIIASSPRVQSSTPANSFHKPPPDGYSDSTYLGYIQGGTYLSRGMVYAGANDGMLHAFKLGKPEQTWTGKGANDKARLTNPDTATALGSEVWSFIPGNALPYLKYLADTNYCHLYLVDMPPLIIDTSAPSGIGTETSTAAKTTAGWKTILIGGMGLGGANKISTDGCTSGATGACVKTPIRDPSDAAKGLGYSSYFALNVTDLASPSLLWEFSDPALGFSTSGAAIIRIGAANTMGKWFAVFASGPTGPIDTTNHQFMGKSDQNLKLFVLDLYTGSVLRIIDTGVNNAFGGSLYNTALDTDKGDASSSGHYSDDVFYLGYTKKDAITSTWTKGGVLRVTTKEDANPANWVVSTVIDNIGPVTSAVVKLQDRTNKHLWLYFGSGRYFYRYDAAIDDARGQQALYGLREPCYNNTTAIPPGPINDIDNTCTSALTTSVLENQSGNTPNPSLSAGKIGWYIALDAAFKKDGTTAATDAETMNGAERIITDPLAAFFGAVFFTTYVPSADMCSSGGNTYLWAVKYDVGNAVGGLRGTALTQMSTGAVHESPLASAFTEKADRRTIAITGAPPSKGQGLAILAGPKPLRKILHIKER